MGCQNSVPPANHADSHGRSEFWHPTGRTDPFEGEFHTLRDYSFAPLPSQGAGLPVWCGGRSDRTLRRTAWLCDGYHAAQLNPEQVAERVPKLRAEAEAAGRPMVTVSVRVRVRLDGAPSRSIPSTAPRQR